jgi:hypothetical protein
LTNSRSNSAVTRSRDVVSRQPPGVPE